MTRDELDLLGAYVKRDVKALGRYSHLAGAGIAAFLKFDLNYLEGQVKEGCWRWRIAPVLTRNCCVKNWTTMPSNILPANWPRWVRWSVWSVECHTVCCPR